MDNEQLVNKIKGLISDIFQREGIELVELSYRRRQEGMVLTFLVDKRGGITLEECSRLNQQIDQLLDKSSIMNERYLLEVSSPGLDRPLRTREDFIRAIGKTVRIISRLPVDGRDVHSGKLYGINDRDIVIIGKDSLSTVISFEDISKARLEINKNHFKINN